MLNKTNHPFVGINKINYKKKHFEYCKNSWCTTILGCTVLLISTQIRSLHAKIYKKAYEIGKSSHSNYDEPFLFPVGIV